MVVWCNGGGMVVRIQLLQSTRYYIQEGTKARLNGVFLQSLLPFWPWLG
jgi:hypothetical protein